MHELKTLPWRELLRSLALPLMLLLAQQGALLHEVSHWTAAQEHDGRKQSPGDDVCVLCLSFAQVDAAAAPQPVVLPLDADLSYSLPLEPASRRKGRRASCRTQSRPAVLPLIAQPTSTPPRVTW